MNRAKPKVAHPTRAATQPITRNRSRVSVAMVVPCVIFLFTAVTFFPNLYNGFVNWDDLDTLITNTRYRGLGVTQLQWMFTTFHLGHYQPLTWLTWSLDYEIWGQDPLGFHLTNVLIHSVNAVLFYLITRRLLKIGSKDSANEPQINLCLAAAFASLVFALHPLRVESVAWITERRDVVSASFLFGSVICYLRATSSQERGYRTRAWMAGALLLYLLSLLSKAMGMTLALVLLILDVYPLRRLSGNPKNWLTPSARKVFFEKAPFLTLGLIFAGVALFAQEHAEALTRLNAYPMPRRLAQAVYGLAFYVWKTLAPLELSPFYQLYPKPNVFNPFDFPFVVSAIVVVAISAACFALRNHWPALLATWLCYGVIVSPVLGFVQSGPQFVADRYSYLSCASWAVLAGAGLRMALRRSWRLREPREKIFVVGGIGGLLLLILAVLTWNQSHVWRTSESLWRYALAVNPRSTRVLVYLGNVLKGQNALPEAADLYEEALRMDPDYADAEYNLAQTLAQLNRLDAAIDRLRRYMDKQPPSALTHIDMGSLLTRQGKTREAITEYQTALTIDPRSAEAHFALGNALAALNELAEAKTHFRRAVELSPQTGSFYLSLGNLLVKQDRLSEAIEVFREAIKVQPGLLPARNNLGRLLAAQGDLPAAIETFRDALRIDPTFAPAHESLALALDQIGNKDEAVEHYREAVRLMQMGSAAASSQNP